MYGHSSSYPLLSLESRLGRLRQRRRRSQLKQLLAVIGPVIMAGSVVLALAAYGVMASVR
ncbi:MAG TPA: hypothetical protein VF383_09870 [Candidatus Dormibacteraeota bacterium]